MHVYKMQKMVLEMHTCFQAHTRQQNNIFWRFLEGKRARRRRFPSRTAFHAACTTGNSTMKVAPLPSSKSHQTRPFSISIIFFTMLNPKPELCSPPVGCADNRANFPKSFFISSGEIPTLSSAISMRTVVDSSLLDIRF